MQKYSIEIYAINEKKSWCDKQTYSKVGYTNIDLPLTVWGNTIWKNLLQRYSYIKKISITSTTSGESFTIDLDTKITSDGTTIMLEPGYTRIHQCYSVLPKIVAYTT